MKERREQLHSLKSAGYIQRHWKKGGESEKMEVFPTIPRAVQLVERMLGFPIMGSSHL